MILRGFKSFVLEICDSKWFVGAFLQIYVIREDLVEKSWRSAGEGAENGNSKLENRLREGMGVL
jgi:hypothetical protein